MTGLIVRINYNDPDLQWFSRWMNRNRWDRRRTENTSSMNLILDPDGHKVKISKTQRTSGCLSYSGHMIKIETFVRLKVNDSIIPFRYGSQRGLCGYLDGKTPNRAKAATTQSN